MYYRLLAAEFLPETLDRVLYLDPDIIVIRPLEELYHMSLSLIHILSVLPHHQWQL